MAPYFRFFLKSLLIITLAFTAAASRADENAPEPPPQFDKGWNLVSVPCDISAADFKQNLKEDALKVYGWNGTSYEEIQTLQRGRGYFININSVLNPSSICKPKPANESITVSLKAGWNLIGNPYHKPVSFTQLLGKAAELPDTGIFELKGDKAIPVLPSSQAKPWSGYWVYTSSDITMQIVNTYKLDIRAYKDSAKTQETAYPAVVLKGGELYFSASVTTQEGPAKSEIQDITAAASWTVSTAAGAFSTGGKFIASSATGAVYVFAGNDGFVSDQIAVNVVDKLPVECDYLIVALDEKETAAHAYYSFDFINYSSYESSCVYNFNIESQDWVYCNDFKSDNDHADIVYERGEKVSPRAFCVKTKERYYIAAIDVSADVEWKVTDDSIISKNAENAFETKALGIAEISAAYGDKTSEKLQFRIMEKKETLSGLHVSWKDDMLNKLLDCKYYANSASGCGGADFLIGKGQSGELSAHGFYDIKLSDGKDEAIAFRVFYNSYGEYYAVSYTNETDITGKVEWQSSDENVGTTGAGGVFTAKSGGTATVSALLDGVTSKSVEIKVYDREILFISIEPANEIKIVPDATAAYRVYAWYLNDVSACNNYYSGGKCLRSEDITELAAMNIIDASLGAIEKGLFVSNGKEGRTLLTAEYKGMKSNGVNLAVKPKTWLILTINGSEASLIPECPNAKCFYVLNGKKARMKVYGKEEASNWSKDEELTSMASWEISDSSIATINSGGELDGRSKGIVWIRATVGDARSDKVPVVIVDDNYEFVIAGTGNNGFKPLKPLKTGDGYYFFAVHYKYNDYRGQFTSSDVTNDSTWNASDSSIAQFQGEKGTVTGVSPGFVDINATYNGLTSNTSTFEVWDERDMKFCDDDAKNTTSWDGDLSKAVLETNCKAYNASDSVYIRYSVEVSNYAMEYLDNCLDLYIMDDKDNIVRTLREEGCSTEKITGHSSNRSAAAPVYQNLTKWDMLDNSGKKVPPGKYFAVARFYILWEPVIRLPFDIVGK